MPILTGVLLSGCVVMEPPDAAPQLPTSGPASAPTAPLDRTALAERSRRDVIPGATAADLDDGRLTPFELQTEMLAFADRYVEAIAEASDLAAANAGDVELRPEFKNVKVIYAMAAISVATMPDPLHALRDFIVMVELQNSVWTVPGPPWAPPAGRARIHRALQDIEAQLLALAQRVMPMQSVEILHAMTNEWRDAHPDRTYVAFVRFSDLGNPERRRRFAAQNDARGLLAPISQAARELEQVRAFSERALFFANHLPLLLEWQAESFVNDTLNTPEVKAMLEDSRRVSLAAEKLGGDLATAITEVGTILGRERSQAILQLGEQFRLERTALFRDLESSATSLLPLAKSISVVAKNLRETALAIGEFADADNSGSEVELAEVKELVLEMNSMTGNAVSLVKSLQQLLNSEASGDAVIALDRLLREHELRLFLYGAVLIVLAGVVTLGVVLASRRSRAT